MFFLAMFLTRASFNSFGNFQKLSPYECGFEPFEDARIRFDIHFYITAILFIIFDVEVSLLFPLSYIFDNINFTSFLYLLIFLSTLFLGFVYEWLRDALSWRSL